jgi:ferric-dicitrate binding protein FerR (iron transport regulator)
MTDFVNKEAGEAHVAHVLRSAGRRADPPDELKRGVRASVQAEWQLIVAERARRRRRLGLSLAAGLAVAALGVRVSVTVLQSPSEVMANASRTMGSVSSKSNSWRASWRTVHQHEPLRAGEELATGTNGRAALSLAGGVSLRLDHNTRIALIDPRHIAIEDGAVYVDSGVAPQAGEQRLQIETPAGVIHHIGTQYEVRLLGTGVQIAVREGKVELSTAVGTTQHADAGEQLTVFGAGGIERHTVSRYGPRWEWAIEAAPGFDIDGRPLAQFLAWAAREQGHDVVFANAASKAEASRVVLSGSVAGLPPSDALAAVLPTTHLRSTERDGQLIIDLDPTAAR